MSSAQGIESHGDAQQVLRSTSDAPLSTAGEGPHVCTVELTSYANLWANLTYNLIFKYERESKI